MKNTSNKIFIFVLSNGARFPVKKNGERGDIFGKFYQIDVYLNETFRKKDKYSYNI